MKMTEEQARSLAEMNQSYSARCLRGIWGVWDAVSDTWVEFDKKVLDIFTGKMKERK
jgi:hypothetical protein